MIQRTKLKGCNRYQIKGELQYYTIVSEKKNIKIINGSTKTNKETDKIRQEKETCIQYIMVIFENCKFHKMA